MNVDIKDMSPGVVSDVLSVAATIGVGLTGYLSYKTGKKISESCKKPKAKDLILPIVSGVATVACLWGSNRISAGQLAMAGAAVGYLAKQRDKLVGWAKKTVKTEQPEQKEQKEPECQRDAYDIGKLPKAAEDSGMGSTLCFEGYFGRWFYSSEEAVKAGIEAFNEFYGGAGASEYNELYREWNLQESQAGWDFGFVGGDSGFHPDEIEFELEWIGIEGVKILQIIPKVSPVEGWYEY